MSHFTINKDKCKRDGICVSECPRLIIELKDNSQAPVPVEDAEQLCIQCGHCVAVARTVLFSLNMKPEIALRSERSGFNC